MLNYDSKKQEIIHLLLAKLIKEITARNTPNPPTINGDCSKYGIFNSEKSTPKLEPKYITDPKPVAMQIKKIPIPIPTSWILIIQSIEYFFINISKTPNRYHWIIMIKSITAIAFIECTLDNNWQTKFGYPDFSRRVDFSQYTAMSDESEVSLVDIGQTRRYFQFKRDSIIQLASNVFSFRSNEANELAIDESKQFPKNTRIDE